METKNMTTLHLRNSVGRSPLRLGLPRVQPIWIIRVFLLIPIVLACFALSSAPNAFGVVPAPDGGYPGGNTAEGTNALLSLTTGDNNTANGFHALYSNTTGSGNTALGYTAGSNLTTGGDNICIGNDGVADDAAVIRIGRSFIAATYIAGISGKTISGGAAVFVNSEGKLGTSTSSARFKDDIKPMGKASEALFALKPVTFYYKKEIDPRGIPQFGLVAEDVEKVNPELVVRDAGGKVNTVRYEQINTMLLNEFLKEHRTVQGLKATLGQQQKEIATLIAHIKEQDAKIQKVSDQLEMSRAAPRVASVK
jgi:hypothetical protein